MVGRRDAPGTRPTTRPSRHRLFRHGVASGDPTQTSVILWTRVEDAGERPVTVEWSVWTAHGEPVQRGRALASPATDHTCNVMVDGLNPGTDYHYVFEARGDRIAGRTRTLPSSATAFRLAVVCCSRWGWPGFDDYATVLAEAPDLVLHLGDYIYEIGEIPPDGPQTDPPHDCHTLDDYRRRYRQHRSHGALQRLHAGVPFLAVWDDHEVADNTPDDPCGERRLAGQRAWREWMPTRSTTAEPQLDRHLQIDGLLDLLLIDARFAGRAPVDSDGPSTSVPDAALLTETQWSRIESAVTSATAWFVLANQVQVAPLTLGWAPALRWPPWRRVVNPDQWDGFPAERRRLLGLLGLARATPVVLSGDLHAGWAWQLRGGDRTVAHEFTAPSVSGTTFAQAVRDQTALPRWFVERLIRLLNAGIDHVDLRRHGFLVVDVTREDLAVTFVHHDGTRVTRTLRSRH